uniref:NADH dehydrogenase subunit 6 n=1 Tax=Neoscona multiplicans TaxID=1112442 RepID=A0A5B7M1R3_9ARAC|nr:NADH dehydrogenase subunit 6 [Neoscona multiplicans]QCF46307.1 NADH dehydrogenase subunit 6 [Neoscona multiplicans]
MMIMLGVLFVLSIQPMMVISSLIIIVLVYSMFLYWSLSSFWFSYMVILVLMSGVLVVFMYMMSVLPNESFEVSSLMILILGFVLMYNSNFYNEFIQDVGLMSMKIWEGTTMLMSMFLVMYLLFIMIIIVWVSMMEVGAIRIY